VDKKKNLYVFASGLQMTGAYLSHNFLAGDAMTHTKYWT
jgi:hypothetical protein